jgi:hypothetical protein
LSVCTCSTPTPAGPLTPDHFSAATWPLVLERQRLPRKVFRRSIAWLSDSLSTLRRIGYPTTTQDSLPAVGQTLLDGLLTRRVPTKGFRMFPTSHSPFPSFAWRNRADRSSERTLVQLFEVDNFRVVTRHRNIVGPLLAARNANVPVGASSCRRVGHWPHARF